LRRANGPCLTGKVRMDEASPEAVCVALKIIWAAD
jgi:hypothetical protein